MSLETEVDNSSRRFDVELFVSHPTLSADDISSMLGLEAHFAHSVGESIITSKRVDFPSVYHDTRWRHSTRCVIEDQWFGVHVKNFVEKLRSRREALLKLKASGGRAELIIQFFSDGYLGDTIAHDTLLALVDLGLDIGIECFV
jgi:hypothetical protein